MIRGSKLPSIALARQPAGPHAGHLRSDGGGIWDSRYRVADRLTPPPDPRPIHLSWETPIVAPGGFTMRAYHCGVVAASAAAVVMSTMIVSAPAHADVREFHDAVGDTGGSSSDIDLVRVNNGGPAGNRVIVTTEVGDLDFDDRVALWVDTVADNPGPEYRSVAIPNSDAIELRRVNTFHGTGQHVDCAGLRISADATGPDRVRFSIPRACMQKPCDVRVSLRGRFPDDDGTVVDWAPAVRRFFGWVPL
ncbi:MAG TPA: hypothetical protein VF468_09570 [Actinomycetota bacterium]|nr:hypothetical protein [Actinomycetota bacterium]